MAELETFLPRVPQPVQPVRPVSPPGPVSLSGAAVPEAEPEETLCSWIIQSCKSGLRSMPKMAGRLAVQLGIVLAINLVLWPLNTWQLPSPLDSLVKVLIFLTATYNNIIPKTIYWVIIFTFGRRLLQRIRKEGPALAVAPIRQIGPEFRKAYAALQRKAWSLLLLGGGLGLVIANNFASYSRFPEARNKMDKYFVALVISFAVSYILGESRQNWLFKFARLAGRDIARLFKRPQSFTDDHTFMLLSGLVAGLLLDAPLIAFKAMYGGYILGAVLAVTAVILRFALKPGERT